MRWKLAPQLQPSLLSPFSWCGDQIIAGFLSTLISMTQPGHAYTVLTWHYWTVIIHCPGSIWSSSSMQYLCQPWPGQSDKTSGKEISHEWVWDQRSGSDSSRWRGQGLLSAYCAGCWYFQRHLSLIAGNKAHHLIPVIGYFQHHHIRFLTWSLRAVVTVFICYSFWLTLLAHHINGNNV